MVGNGDTEVQDAAEVKLLALWRVKPTKAVGQVRSALLPDRVSETVGRAVETNRVYPIASSALSSTPKTGVVPRVP